MKYLFSICLFLGGVLAVYYAIQLLCSREKKYVENQLLAVLCIASAVWSFGFSGLIVQRRLEPAYFCWSFGMAGVFMYLITAQLLVVYVSGISGRMRLILNRTALSGIIVYILTINSRVMFLPNRSGGMTPYLENNILNIIYIFYLSASAVSMLGASIYILKKADAKRLQAFALKYLFLVIVLLFCILSGYTFPMIKRFSVIVSSVIQCGGMIVLYYAVNVINHAKINIMNMSEFIYYSLAMPVLVYDSDRNIHIMNDAAVDFFETDREYMEIEKIGISQLFAVDEDEVFRFDEKHRDIDAISKKSRLYCSLAVSKIIDAYGDVIGYIIIVTDLSERNKAMEELEEAKYEAETANNAKSTFLAKMSHEIRTPMNAIVGFSELALKSELSAQVREYVEDIKTSSNNLLAIINDILDISKIESGRMELVCGEYFPAKLFQDVYLIIQTQVKNKGLEFYIDIDPDIPRKLYGDKVRIRSILINLLNNAVKYTRQGSISFKADIFGRKEDQVTLRFQVKDTGTGIREEEQDRLFQIFSQLDQKMHYGVEGTGLGLAIVKGYVSLMGGYITVDSVYGEGSVFTAVIEQKILDAAPLDRSYILEDEDTDGFSISGIKIHGIRVLVVDDNLVNLKVAGSSLSYYGLNVDTASSGEEAVRLCGENQYQMIFMDQMMPQMDGIEAMQRIRSLNGHYAAGGSCKIIVLTANAVSGVRNRLVELGFDEYLGKPMNYHQLERLFVRFLPEENIEFAEDSENSLIETQTGQRAKSESWDSRSAGSGLMEVYPGSAAFIQKEDEVHQLQELLPEADVRPGIQNCGGHFEDYLSVLQVVYESGHKQLLELHQLLEQADYENYTIQIHAVKGAALSIGAKNMAELAKRLEAAGKKADGDYISSHMEEFCQKFISLLGQIRKVLQQYHLPATDIDADWGRALSEQEMMDRLREIGRCLDEFDYAKSAELIRTLQEQEVPERFRTFAGQLGQWMEEMDVERILDEIRRLLYDWDIRKKTWQP